MSRFLEWVRKIDFRNLTPLQWGIGIVGVLVALSVVSFILNLAMTLLPIALLGLIVYVAYSALKSRGEDSAEALQKLKREEKLKRDEKPKRAEQYDDPITERLVIVEEAPQPSAKEPSQDEIAAQLEERRRRLLKNNDE